MNSIVLVKIPGEPPYYGMVKGFGSHGPHPYVRINKGGADNYGVSLDYIENV